MSRQRDPERARRRVVVSLAPGWLDEPLQALRSLGTADRHVAAALQRAVAAARKQGHTWEKIGAVLGMSRQAAWERFANRGGRRAQSKGTGTRTATGARRRNA